MKRPLKWVLLELLLWAAVAIGTAVALVALSESILPANF
jgi:hypothetical protein